MELSRQKKILFCLHLIVTLFSFFLLVSDSWYGLGLLLFGMIEFLFSIVLCKSKKWALILSGSVLVLCATSFYRDNPFRYVNYLAFIILLSAQTVLSISDADGFKISSLLKSLFAPFFHIAVPFCWVGKAVKNKNSYLGKGFITAVITLIVLAIVLVLLSNADMVFSKGVDALFSDFFNIFRAEGIFRLYLSAFITIYIFGAFYATNHIPSAAVAIRKEPGFLLSFSPSFLLFSLIAVYCIFCAIQIKYLFLGAALPVGITHAEYARKGFFELLVVSAINLAVVLSSFAIAGKREKGKKLILSLCLTLLSITVFLLFCSFWRMYLYYLAAGLTRLRTLVFIFLIFEFIGLIITFFYLSKPKFNIIYIYFMLMLSFWLTVNIVSIDRIVAKNQVDLYLDGKQGDIMYVTTLSSDAAPEIKRLVDSGRNEYVNTTNNYFRNVNACHSWQQFNIAEYKAFKIKEEAGL